jgi:hypothetical protein
MAETAELTTLRRAIDELRGCVGELRERYGEIPAVQRLVGYVDRLDLDAADLDLLRPRTNPPADMLEVSDEPLDPSLWANADDEGLGGYHRGSDR